MNCHYVVTVSANAGQQVFKEQGKTGPRGDHWRFRTSRMTTKFEILFGTFSGTVQKIQN